MQSPRLFDDPMRGIGDNCLPASRQFFCRDQAREHALLWRPGERIPVLPLDLHRHDDGDQKPLGDGSHEQVAYLRLTCCKNRLRRYRTPPSGSGLPKGTAVLTSCCMLRSMSTILPLRCRASEASAWCWNSAKSLWRSDREAANACS